MSWPEPNKNQEGKSPKHVEVSIKCQYNNTLRSSIQNPIIPNKFDIITINKKVVSMIDKEFRPFLQKKIEYSDVVNTTGSAAIGGRDIILLNENWENPVWREKYKKEWWDVASTGGTIEGVLLHEYGHGILHKITNDNLKFYRNKIEPYIIEKYENICSGGSPYAYEGHSEFVAEAFADYHLNKNKATQSSKQIIQLLKEGIK